MLIVKIELDMHIPDVVFEDKLNKLSRFKEKNIFTSIQKLCKAWQVRLWVITLPQLNSIKLNSIEYVKRTFSVSIGVLKKNL